uniref:Tensin 2b n=1 Tax=Salmo trutta TaxID=8032 RepID=A0A674DU16_SALTR
MLACVLTMFTSVCMRSDPQGSRARKLYVTLEPALLLKGDIMVKCYHRRLRGSEREVVFRLQFHTCTVHRAQLWFSKGELDLACAGQEYRKNEPSVTVDCNTSDPVMRWDSYENFNLHHQDSTEDISHTRGPLDGSLYALVKKHRGRGSVSVADASPNACPTGNPTAKPPPPAQPQSQPPPLSLSSDSGHSSNPSEHMEDPPPCPLSRLEKEKKVVDCLLRRGEGGERDREMQRERDREMAILDDGDSVPDIELRREQWSCCVRAGHGRRCQRCGEASGWERELCFANGHCMARCNSSTKGNPKSRALPALPSQQPVSPRPLEPHLDMCHRHSAHTLSKLPWECPPPPLPCLHRPCYPYPAPEHAHPNAHTIPASNRLFCGGEECRVFHYPAPRPDPPRLSHQSLPFSPYREMFFSPAARPRSDGCPCRDCTCRRAHQSASARAFHPLCPDQPESLHWPRGQDSELWDRDAGLRRGREGPSQFWEPENPWEAEREAEFCQRRSVGGMSPYRGPGYPSPQPLLDSPGGSSGYNTPQPPRHSCPCSPYQQASPLESHGSPRCASGSQSGSTLPLSPGSPNPGDSQSKPPTDRQQQTDGHTYVVQNSVGMEDSSSQGSLGQSEKKPDEQTFDDTVEGSPPSPPDGPQEPSQGPQQIEPLSGTPVSAEPASTSTILEPNTNSNSSTPETEMTPHQAVKSTTTPTASTDSQNQGSDSCSKESIQMLSECVNPSDSQQVHMEVHTVSTSVHPPPTTAEDGELKVVERVLEMSTQTAAVPSARHSIVPVQVNLNGSGSPQSERGCTASPSPCSTLSSAPPSPHLYIGSPERRPSPQPSPLAMDPAGRRLTPVSDSDPKIPSPVSDGYNTPTFPLASYYYPLLNIPHVPYSGYTAVTIPAAQPPLPEKRRLSSMPGYRNGHGSQSILSSSLGAIGPMGTSPQSSPLHVIVSPSVGGLPPPVRRGLAPPSVREESSKVNAKFVQDSSKFWYKPGISRDQAIALLKDKEPGSFLIRNSNSFQGAYGLALKVASHPLNNVNNNKVFDQEHLVRHFLIETGSRGVKIKGCQNESYFGSLSALVYQHSLTPISLPCALFIPEKDLVGELQSDSNTSTAADLLKQGAACNVLYLNSVETESLTGPQAVSKATRCTLTQSPQPMATMVHFKVSTQGITLTDSQRRLFFRRHYPINSVTFSSVDPQNKRWTNSDKKSSKVFGFVARRTGSTSENVCHLFAEMDTEQPAVAIVNFINKVMLGPQQQQRR